MTHRVSNSDAGGRTVYRLHDDESGASAAILPSYGFNLFDLRLPAAGAVRPVVWAEPGWESNPQKPARNGIPVLFPFPNRIKDAQFEFEGRSYQLVPNKPPHAIHGFALDADWDVVEHVADEVGAHLAGRFQIAKQAPEALGRWPADAILELRYSLAGRRLDFRIIVENPTEADLPFGFGIHPYFRMPMDPENDPTRAIMTLPAARYWVLDGGIPTGERRSVDERLDFRSGKPFAGLPLDDDLTDLSYQGDRGVCRLDDLTLGASLRLEFDRHFRELVVFNPPGPSGIIAVEPYTQATDAIHLNARGIDAGLRVLKPGGRVEMGLALVTTG